MNNKNIKSVHGENKSSLVQKSSDTPSQMSGSQDAPSMNHPSITQSKGRLNHELNPDL